ncbi:NADPH oxidase organizer 1-like [Xyrauchen texanus]|uniref:NADPH oxidase organizer 1-like n=1 Tax=Xyrauchen texanus TaxID=154827 RepID=UPI002241B655|nr:NADPH oxidase organizer 1-like [Xyrauchen texanus]
MVEQRFPVNIQLVGVMHKEAAKLYMTTVLWSDQNEITVYRSLKDFKTLHRQLKKKFPPSNPIKSSGRIVPKFKAVKMRRNMQKWSPSKSVLRLKSLEEYCNELLHSDPQISQSSELIRFLLPKPQELNADFAKNSIVIMPSETSLGSSGVGTSDNGVTQPFVTETYCCVATYETKDTKNRPFKVEVDEIVDVLFKDKGGWWLVENEARRLAWFPAPYLKRAELDDDDADVMDGGSVLYVAAKSYKAMNSDEISIEIGSLVEVLQKSDNGWWIIRYNQKAGYVPSMYLQPYNNPWVHITARREILRSTLDLVQLRVPGSNSMQVTNSELCKFQGNLIVPLGSGLGPKDKQMSRSMGTLLDARPTNQTSPSIRAEFAQKGQQGSLSDDDEDYSFSDDGSSSRSDSLNCSVTEQRFRQSSTHTPNFSGSLNRDSATEGKIISSSSDPNLNKMPSTPNVPPRPQAQEILKRCTTITRKNLQRTS